MKKFFLLFLIQIQLLNASNAFAQEINSLGGGVTMNGNVVATVYDSTYNLLYIAGEIRAVDGVPVGNVAMWDGTSWHSLNGGMNGHISCLKLFGHLLFAGGTFSQAGGINANNVAYWDGVSWNPLGNGLPYSISAIEFFNNVLFATAFVPGNYVNRLYNFDGLSWNTTSMEFDRAVNGMLSSDSALFIYGTFQHANADSAYGMVSYNGTSFFKYPPSTLYGIRSIVFLDSSIYVAGYDRYAGQWKNGIWQTTSFGVLAEDMSFIYKYRDTLYTVTDSASRGAVFHIKKIVNGIAQPPTARLRINYYNDYNINSYCSSGNNLFLGSNLTRFGDTLAMCLFHYNGQSWSNPGKIAFRDLLNGFDYSYVNCMVKDSVSGDLIVGGRFFFAGNNYCANVARWDGTQWNAMGNGLSSEVKELVYYNNELYAVGYFARSGPDYVGGIAKWNGTSWQATGSGVNFLALTATVYRNELYVGGTFDTINGVAAKYCAKYDGTNWSSVGFNYVLPISVLTVYKDTLVAGLSSESGSFQDTIRFFRYHGSIWMNMGSHSHYNRIVNSMLVLNDSLYAASEFYAGIVIERWDNGTWVHLDTIGSSSLHLGRVFNFHGQLAASCLSCGFNLYDGTKFNNYSRMNIYYTYSESPIKDYIFGCFGRIYHDLTPIELNNAATLDIIPPQVNVTLDNDTICERQYAFYHAESNDAFIILHWHFLGGQPDTISYGWNPVIQYLNPGSFPTYVVATNLIGTDTIYFTNNITVLPCISDVQDLSSQHKLMFYPNPFDNIINITSEEKLKDVFITDISGRIVIVTDPSISQIDLSELSSGIYILKCISNQRESTFRIIKQ